jgi:hypothetical protein
MMDVSHHSCMQIRGIPATSRDFKSLEDLHENVVTDHRVASQWFWRKPSAQGGEESLGGFGTKKECEDDARRHGSTGTFDVEQL